MSISLLKKLFFLILLGACASSSRNSQSQPDIYPVDISQPAVPDSARPQSLTDLPQTEHGGFVLKPGFYEAEFKTYCLQPGTPDPSPRDAYLQGPVTGYRSDIIESVLVNSGKNRNVDQRNVQLLLWSVVSGSDFNKLSPAVKSDAMRLLTAKQIFELQGGVLGLIKTVSSSTGIFSANKDMQRLFESSVSSYETFERLAVLREPSQVKRAGVKADQWYKQKQNYYVRYFPVSYKKVRIQVYVPEGLLDADGKIGGDYLVFDPTGQQAIPAFTNAQRLGIGGTVLDAVRIIIKVGKENGERRKEPQTRREQPQVKKF